MICCETREALVTSDAGPATDWYVYTTAHLCGCGYKPRNHTLQLHITGFALHISSTLFWDFRFVLKQTGTLGTPLYMSKTCYTESSIKWQVCLRGVVFHSGDLLSCWFYFHKCFALRNIRGMFQAARYKKLRCASAIHHFSDLCVNWCLWAGARTCFRTLQHTPSPFLLSWLF